VVGDMVGSFRHGVTSLAGGDSVGLAETKQERVTLILCFKRAWRGDSIGIPRKVLVICS